MLPKCKLEAIAFLKPNLPLVIKVGVDTAARRFFMLDCPRWKDFISMLFYS
jgi:hypothetical protein